MEGSPWEAALGEHADLLHPRLRAYFSQLPPGSVGRGDGVFEVVGTPRRWLWPVLAILGADGVLFAAWQRDVPFTVENRPSDGRVLATRNFAFDRGDRLMVDEVGYTGGRLWDRLGRHGLVKAWLEASVHDGGLTLRSTRVRVAGIPIPRWISPRLELTERWDSAVSRQRVSLVLEAPGLGRLYEYAGHFTYEIVDA